MRRGKVFDGLDSYLNTTVANRLSLIKKFSEHKDYRLSCKEMASERSAVFLIIFSENRGCDTRGHAQCILK